MIDELSRSIRAHLYERITNPFLGAVAIAWCFWNYKLILVLLSADSVVWKIEFIQSRLYLGWLDVVLYFLVFPLLSGLAFLFAYPIPARFVYRYSRKQLKVLKSIKLEVDDETPVSQEEYVKLRRKVNELENRYYTDLTDKDAEISRLQSMLVAGKDSTGSTSEVTTNNIKRGSSSAQRAAQEIERKSEESKLVEKGDIRHKRITAAKIGEQWYRLGGDIKTDVPGKVNVFKLKESFKYEEKIPVTLEIDGSLEPGQIVWVFDGYSHRELDGFEFELQKADFEEKNARIAIHQQNPLKPGKQIVVSNIIQFSY